MYLGISLENFITVSLMMLVLMLFLHILAQFGVRIATWLPGGG